MDNYGFIGFIPKQKTTNIGEWFGKLTGLFTKKESLPPLAHCGIMISETEMIHAWYSVRLDKIADIAKYYDGYIIFKCQCPDYNHAHAISHAARKLGKLYDVIGLIGIIKKYLSIGNNNLNKYDKQFLYWCSELVLECLDKGDCKNAKNIKDGYESPADIADLKCMRMCFQSGQTNC